MYEPVGVVCHLKVGGIDSEYVVTARVLSDHVKQNLRRLVKDRKREDISSTTKILESVRREFSNPADFAELRMETMKRLAGMIVDCGRASEEEALDLVNTEPGAALVFHHGVDAAPDLESCRTIMQDTGNFIAFMRAVNEAIEEHAAAVKNSESQEDQP